VTRLSMVVVVFAISLMPSVAGQQQPAFKGATRTVAVYATVADGRGSLVTELSKDEFIVEDNGKPQEITVFSGDVQPITVVVMLDRSGSMRLNFDIVQQASGQFVREMQPGDKARIGSFSNEVLIDPPEFTSDKDALYKVLESGLQPEGPTPLWNALDAAISALRDEDGRRVVLVFTDGVDKPLNFKRNNSSLKDVMQRAVRENVMVYAIGLAGQTGMPTIGGAGRSMGRIGSQPRWPGGGEGPSFEQPDEGLSKIAAQTGGGYFELTGTANLARTFSRVADELHHQYALGFSPAVLDGKTHSIEVKVKGTPMYIRARTSYVATPERP